MLAKVEYKVVVVRIFSTRGVLPYEKDGDARITF